MFCPSCCAEYRPGFNVCSDCGVALVAELPQESEPKQSQAVLAWSGDDATLHAQASAALERAGVQPYTVSHEDRLFGTNEQARFQIYVSPEMAGRAEEVLNDPAFSGEDWAQLAESGAFELPAENDGEEAAPERSEADWHPDDADTEIWSGDDADTAKMIAASLRENGIEYRTNRSPEPGAAEQSSVLRLLVLPSDGTRAKKIVREILYANPF